MLSDARIRPLVKLLYVAAALILFNQLVEILTGLGPIRIQPGAPAFRFRLFGVLASRAGWLVVTDALLFAAVIRLDDRRGLRLLGWFNLGAGITMMFGLLLVAHDGMALRNTVAGHAVDLAVIRTGIPLGLVVVMAVMAGWFSVRKSRKPDWSGKKRPMTPLFTDTAPAVSPRRRADDPPLT